MDGETRVFSTTDPDYPTTKAMQSRLMAAGRARQEAPAAGPPPETGAAGEDGRPVIPLGRTATGTMHLDLNRLLAGRLLIQGSSGAGKSEALRHIVEEAHDYITVMIVDPEGEFGGLAAHIVPFTTVIDEIDEDLTLKGLKLLYERNR